MSMAGNDKTKILLIDDNDVSRAMLRFILSSEPGYEVVGEAASGMQGLEMAGSLQPQLVCLDVMMPDMNGLDVLKQIKEQWPRTVVLMVTGSNDSATIQGAVQGGAGGYIVKPFNPAVLLGTVERAIAKGRAFPPGTK
jgi:two-component system, chemotaxis family, chemotaxis protein CheY